MANNISNYIQRILDADENDAWCIAHEMTESEDIKSLLLKQYQTIADASYTFKDSTHELMMDLMENDRRKLREIRVVDLSGKWLLTCYTRAMKRCDLHYLNSKKAYINSMMSMLNEKRHEIDDRTWVLCIMLVKMEDSLDALWLFIFYRMQLRQHKTRGLEIRAKEIAQAMGIPHQRYRDRVTYIRSKSQKILKSTKMSDLNNFSLEQQQRVADYVTAVCDQGSLEDIFFQKYQTLIDELPCGEAINKVISEESEGRLIEDQYAFKRLPHDGFCFEPLPGSAEEEILQDNAEYERPARYDTPQNVDEVSMLYLMLVALMRQEQFLKDWSDEI